MAPRSATHNTIILSVGSPQLIPLSNLVTFVEKADAGNLNRYNRVRSITLSSNLAEGYSLGEALDWLDKYLGPVGAGN